MSDAKILDETTKQAPQGDVLFTLIDKLPDGLLRIDSPVDHVLAHSETGHHHVMSADSAHFYQDPKNPLVAYIDVKKPAQARHLRSYRTHETILFVPGIFRINRQAEETPEGWVRVAD